VSRAAKNKNTLIEFLHEKRNEPADIDWKAKKEDWVSSVKRLYSYLKGNLLKELIDDKTVGVSEVPKQIHEDYIGDYTVPELRLKIGSTQVVFSPKGANVIGAAGRIDLRGDRGTVTLIREKGSGGSAEQWKIVVQRVPTLETMYLDSDGLKWALEHVML
jgi:hypothetical protein